jgi:hypothetical protein
MQDVRASASTIDVFQDENTSNCSSFAQMTQAFSQRIAELQQLVCFRVEGVFALQHCQLLLLEVVSTACVSMSADSVKHIFVRDIQGIEVRPNPKPLASPGL